MRNKYQVDQEFYQEQGYLFPLPALTPRQADGYHSRLDKLLERYGDRARNILGSKSHLAIPWLSQLIRNPRILEPICQILGNDIFCWSTTFFIKEPNDPRFVSWHQDATYWGLSSDEVVTAWIALTDSSSDNGCVRYCSRSHKFLQQPHKDTFHPDNFLGRGQEVQIEVDENRAIDVILEPGQMSLHHVLMIHGSGPNLTNRPRIGLAIRYIPTRIRQTSGTLGTATLVHGSDNYGHFTHERSPRKLMNNYELEYLQKVDDLHNSFLYGDISKNK